MGNRAVMLLVVIFALLSTVASAQERPRKVTPCTAEELQSAVGKVSFVAEVKVVKVFSPPLFWSGIIAAMQSVQYEIVTMLRGELEQDVLKRRNIVVSHYIVFNSPYAGDHAELSRTWFRAGSRLLLLFDRGPGYDWKDAASYRSGENPLRKVTRESDRATPLGREREKSDKTFAEEPVPEYNSSDNVCGVVQSNSVEYKTVIERLKKANDSSKQNKN